MDNKKEATSVEIMKDGPYIIKGPISLNDENGNKIELIKNINALCRCNNSKNKPFCDGTHSKAFKLSEKIL